MLTRTWCPASALILCAAMGCGTTRSTDTVRAATEMLLVSQAVDRAVAQIDFTPMSGKAVYLNSENVDKTTVDRGYLISSIRQQLLAHGALIKDDEKEAMYVVELRTGGVGTDRHSVLVGTPQLQIPALIPGLPTNIPEVALFKKTDQKGIAKIGVFTYNRVTGRAVWQSGIVEETSSLKDRWFLGSGPYSDGTIRQKAEFAGEVLPSLPKIPLINPAEQEHVPLHSQGIRLTDGYQWDNSATPTPPQPIPFAFLGLSGAAAIVNHPILQ